MPETKTLYIDAAAQSGAWGVLARDARILQAGTTIYSMPASDRNAEYARWVREYDIHFLFDDQPQPAPSFYAVPRLDIFAVDSTGGCLATLGALTDLESDAPIVYLSGENQVYQVAPSGPEFLKIAPEWRQHLTPCEGIDFYESRAAAQEALEFISLPSLC